MSTSGSAPFLLSKKRSILNSPLYVVIVAGAVATLSYLAAAVGGTLVLRPEMIWPLWPGCALLVAVLLLTPKKTWPVFLIAGLTGFAFYDIRAGMAFRPMSLYLIGDAIEILVAAVGVSYLFGGVPKLANLKSLSRYCLLAVILAPLPAASIGALAQGGNYWVSWRISYLTEALALLTLTPAALSWIYSAGKWAEKPRTYYLEGAAVLTGLLVLGYFTFIASGKNENPALLYSLVPFFLWSALRLGTAGTANSILIVGFLSIWGVVHGRGPFTGDTPVNDVFSLQLFLIFAAASFMVLSAIAEEDAQAHHALQESEERFRLVADSAPALIWMSGTDTLTTYLNAAWFAFTGRSISQEIGNGWAENVHPEDRQRCLDAYTNSFEQRAKYQSEYRLRRHDGEYRWILDTGVPRFNQDGSFAGYIGICVDVTDRKSAEQERDLMHERLRLAMKSGKAVGWDLDVATGKDFWFGDLQTQFGISSDTFSGRVEEFYRRLHPEDRARVAKAVQDAKRSHIPYAAEFRILWPDGTIRWIAADGKFEYAPDGEAQRMSGISIDITDRKRTEDALRESEERLRLAAQIGKMYAAEWDVASDMVVQSPDFVKMTGEAGPERLTLPQLLETIHPEDRDNFSAALANLTPQHPTVQVTYRLAPSEGTVTWLEKSARAFFDEQGKMQRVISMVADITDHKLAEEALSGLSRRLIEAQERERTRIARELHDDIAQRLAMLTIELQRLQHEPPDSPAEVSSRLGEIRSQTLEISTDVQTLSHELHSSKLEYLGLVPAIKGFCKEFTEQNGLEIDFGSHDLPSQLPADVSLGLFRVVQEALHNAAKHSMVRRAVVRLWGSPSGIDLTVSDLGEGFDVEAAMSGPGLGLTSMSERLHLLNGEIRIESAPSQGTTIHAHVPLDQEDSSARRAS